MSIAMKSKVLIVTAPKVVGCDERNQSLLSVTRGSVFDRDGGKGLLIATESSVVDRDGTNGS